VTEAVKIEDDRVVALTFTLTDTTGEELDRATEDGPLLYLHGHGNVMEGLEKALAGRGTGDPFEIELAPEEAFGLRMDDAERTIPRDAFPDDLSLEAGMELMMEDDDDVISFWIKAVHADRILIDLNHPFAGRTVRFTGNVLNVRVATAEELDHGHPHGLQGHDHHH
jgi:FKBP-type peptidyl-prolyl cis-trans isomerase SlyD